MAKGSAQVSGDRQKVQSNQEIVQVSKITPNPETSLIKTYRGERVINNHSKQRGTIITTPEVK